MKNIKTILLILVTNLILAVIVFYLLGAIPLGGSKKGQERTETLKKVSEDRLEKSLTLSREYYQGLYNEVGEENAVMAEYYAFPVNIYHKGKLYLAGIEGRVTNYKATRDTESFTIIYPNVTLPVFVDWKKKEVTIRTKQPVENLLVFIGNQPVTIFSRNYQKTTTDIPERKYLRSNRYTIRHATQLGSFLLDATKSAKLTNTLDSLGLQRDHDLHAPIAGRGSQYEDFIYKPTAFYDCNKELIAYDFAYPYKSKVCSLNFGVEAYIQLSKTDYLAPAQQAIHNLNRGEKQEEAKKLFSTMKREFDKHGFISTCPTIPPFGCEHKQASTIRLAHFGKLALQLREYETADRVVATLLSHQIRRGVVKVRGKEFYRPYQTGSIPLAWDSNGSFISDEAKPYELLGFLLNMRSEYGGAIITNAETMGDVIAFLEDYQCRRYGKECFI